MSRPIGEESYASAIGQNASVGYSLARRPDGPGRFQVRLFFDDEAVVAGDNSAQIMLIIPQDLDGARLQDCRVAVTTAIGAVTVQIRNHTQADVDMLTTPLTIDAGEKSSRTAATPAVIDPANRTVQADDEIAFDIDVAGGTLGMVAIVGFW